MFLFGPWSGIFIVYIVAAVLPAALLLGYVYRRDRIEKEPAGLIWSLILCGVLAALCSIALEMLGQWILDRQISRSNPAYVIVLAFLVVAVAEEGTKLIFLKLRSWRDPNFSHMFDAVVYSAAVSLGFAAFENIKYVFAYGLQVALPRALLAIPGHLGFSVFMGVFYGRAKLCEARGDRVGRTLNLLLGYLSAVFLHGFYDSCAMIGTPAANVVFFIFVAVMYFIVYRMIKKASSGDRPIY